MLSVLCKGRVERALLAAAIAYCVNDSVCKRATRIGKHERTDSKDCMYSQIGPSKIQSEITVPKTAQFECIEVCFDLFHFLSGFALVRGQHEPHGLSECVFNGSQYDSHWLVLHSVQL